MDERRHYREVAIQCLQIARAAKDVANVTVLLDVAIKWLDLADQDATTQAIREQIEAMRAPN